MMQLCSTCENTSTKSPGPAGTAGGGIPDACRTGEGDGDGSSGAGAGTGTGVGTPAPPPGGECDSSEGLMPGVASVKASPGAAMCSRNVAPLPPG